MDTREFMGTVKVENGIIVISGVQKKDGVENRAIYEASSSVDGYTEWGGLVAFQTKWKDGEYEVFGYKDEDNHFTSVELKLKED